MTELFFVKTKQQISGNTLCITGDFCEVWAEKSRSKPFSPYLNSPKRLSFLLFQSIRPRLVIKYPYSLTPWDKFFKYKIFADLFAAYEFHGVVAADGAEDAVFDIGPQRGDERAEVCGGGVEYLVAQPGDILGGRAPQIAAAA